MKIDTTGATDWRRLREFSAVDLDQSFILSWHVESETLLVEIDVCLASEHPFYEKPRPAERVCIRPAVIEFPFCEQMTIGEGGGDDLVRSSEEVAESLGHGAITGLQRHEDGRYEINGEFGTVFVTAERPLLRLKGL